MKTRFSLLLALCAAVAFNTAAMADDDTPLGKEMSVMQKSMRKLKDGIADPTKKAENLQLIAALKKSAEASVNLDPASTKDAPDKAAYTAKYKEQMKETLATINALEEAVKADKVTDAQAAYAKLNEEKKKGHEEFKKD